MDYKKLIAKGESKTLELKVIIPSNDKIAKTACAFANTSGGKLIIGVSDDLEIVGLEDLDFFSAKDAIISVVYDKISPTIPLDVFTVTIDEKLLLVIDVAKGPQSPYFYNKTSKERNAYVRLGTSNRIADNAMIQELIRQSRNISFDEEAEYDYELNDLDLAPINSRFSKLGLELNESSLINLGLATKVNDKLHPSKGLLLLLGTYEHCSIKCARFKGDDMRTFIDKKEYSSDIFTQLEQAEAFCYNHINVGAEINGLQRVDIPEIPLDAIREALLNALVHRDYTNSGRDIKVSIFDSYIRILSPGALPPNIRYEDIFDGRSEIRNKVLAKFMNKLDFIEKWGTGINRIIKACESMELRQPDIIEKNDFFEVKLYRSAKENNNTAVNENKHDRTITDENGRLLDDNRTKVNDYGRLRSITVDYGRLEIEKQDILLYLLDNKTITRKETMDVFGYKTTKATDLLAEMTNEGLIVRQGSGRSTHYLLKESLN